MHKGMLINLRFGRNKDKYFSVRDFRKIRKENRAEFGDDPDINSKRQWGIRTNGVKKGNPEDSCLDWDLHLGHIVINYTNFDYNAQYR